MRVNDLLPAPDVTVADPAFPPHRWAAELTPRRTVRLLVLGLILRLAGAFLYGTQDVEYWKGYSDYAVHHTLPDIYGGTDEEIISQWRQGATFVQILVATQRWIPFRDVHQYSVKAYPLCQPPLFLYSIYPGAWLYQFVSPSMRNGNLFNFFTNLQPVFFSALMAWIIGRYAGRHLGAPLARLAAIAFWLNPLVILNTPIQGYQDALCSMLALLSVIAVHDRRVNRAYVFLAMALLTKPWALFVAPAILWMCFREHSLKRNVLAIAAAGLVSGVICAPFLLTGHFLSMVLGVLLLGVHSLKLSLQAMNLWWPVQYAADTWVLMHDFGMTFWESQRHRAVFEDVPTAGFHFRFGVNAGLISLILWGIFTILNLAWMTRESVTDRRVIVLGCAIQAWGWYILRTGLQGHHSFIIIPILSLLAFASMPLLRRYTLLCVILFIQELTFYGLGRDFNPGKNLLSALGLPVLTVLLALAHVAFFVRCIRELGLFQVSFGRVPRDRAAT